MPNELPTDAETGPAAAPSPADDAPAAPAEPRTVRSPAARDLIFKHAADRRTLDRMLARMRGR